MRKDYVAVGADAGHPDETAFVADYWTKVWRSVGGPTGAVDKVARKEEYRHMRRYVERLPKGARLLDGGCGLGEWTAFFSGLGYPTLGLDISAETVGQLRTVFSGQRFEVGDIRATGLPDASFDGYFSWGTFEHFEEGLDPCLKEAWRLLKPGGYLFITTPFDNLRHAAAAAFDRRRAAGPAAGRHRFYQWRLTRGEMRGYLTNNGFEVLDLVPIAKRQGIVRILWQWFGLHYDTKAAKALGYGLAPFVWSGLVAHMLMGIARKPGP
jgi:SAM-dependent methyltransferase